jgi:hypothetical protein
MGNPASFVTAASTADRNTFAAAQTFSGGIAVTGGITGGVRQVVPFGQTNIVAGDNATPASSTPVQTHWCASTALTTAAFVAMRAGSVTGLSINLNTAAAGSSLIVGVYKNGTIINAAAIVTLATTDVKGHGTFTSGSCTFVAGDVIDVRIRTGSGWSATAADCSIAVEIET